MFLQVSVHRGCLPHCMLEYPLRQTPPRADTPPGQRTVRILLECILVLVVLSVKFIDTEWNSLRIIVMYLDFLSFYSSYLSELLLQQHGRKLIKCFLAFAKFVHFWNRVEIFEEKIDIPLNNYENKKNTNQKSCAMKKGKKIRWWKFHWLACCSTMAQERMRVEEQYFSASECKKVQTNYSS